MLLLNLGVTWWIICTAFLYTQERLLLVFFYYCTVSAAALENRHGTLALSTLSGLQSLVYDPLQPQDCKHWYFEGEEPKDRRQPRVWEITESN